MKKLLLILTILFWTNFVQAQTKADTIKTILFYSDPTSSEPKLDIGYRIIMDTLKFIRVDAETFKKKKVLDTIYFVPVVYAKLDETKKPKLDTSGNQLFEIRYTQISSLLVFFDGGKNVDKIFEKYYASKPKEDKKEKPKQ